MAEAALFGIAKSVLQQLGSPALDEFRLLWGHKEQFQKLEDTVTTIRNVLQDADRKQATDVAVQGWLVRLRVVLYEADDFFDAISAKLLLEKNKKGTKIVKKVRHFISKPYRFAFLVKNAHKVNKIKDRFDDIAGDINKYNFLLSQPDVVATSRIRRDQTHSFVPKSVVVGREQETEKLVGMLLADSSEEQRDVSVIAVIGIGGLGKTTLAQLVYNDDRVQKGFDLCMWACINYLLDLKQVLITLLKSPTKSVPTDLDLEQLQLLFREQIQENRFLLVLDDVWDVDLQTWRMLKELLSVGKDGSKVLTTTRSNAIAQHLWAMQPYFHLEVLSDESAWLLFKKIAFEDEEYLNNSELEELGRMIERKCANVPLAIVTIASLLREKAKERWPLVNEELSKLFLSRAYNDTIMPVLEFSYNELPYPVKRCFGYCSLFRKDYKFQKDSLIHLWIAQGFIEPLSNQRLEDIAEEYFLCLLDRCFFHLTTRDELLDRWFFHRTTRGEETKSIVTYQMHDLMHDLATKVTESESILVDNTDQRPWEKTIRHVSINCKWESMVDHVCYFSHSKSLRTFLQPCGDFFNANALENLMLSFKSLRVLSLSGIQDLPTSIGKLIHLRFLDLSKNCMDKLPSSICSLSHLQCLILRSCKSEDLEFPKEMGDLLSLRHLDLSKNKATRLPRSICRVRHLESLILRGCKHLKELPEELGDLLSLRHLVLEGCDSLVKMSTGLAALRLEFIKEEIIWHIIGSEATSSTSHGNSALKELEIREIEDLRSTAEAQIRHLSALQHISIFCSGVESIALNGLAYLTSLEHLQIDKWGGMNWVGQEEEVRRIHLPRVRHLKIPTVNRNLFEGMKDMASLEYLAIGDYFNEELQEEDEEEEGLSWKNMRKLREVELVFGEGFSMRNNQRLLNGFQYLTSLKSLTLMRCKELYLSWRALLRLPHLHDLSITHVEEVIDVDSDAMMIQTQPIRGSLRKLSIISCSGEWVHDIPWKCLPFLESLTLHDMRNLKSLPEGIQHLSALEDLSVHDNPGVVSLPHWMSSLLSLRFFNAWGCSEELKNRCNRQTGEDWPKIQHIPVIKIWQAYTPLDTSSSLSFDESLN